MSTQVIQRSLSATSLCNMSRENDQYLSKNFSKELEILEMLFRNHVGGRIGIQEVVCCFL